MEVVHAGGQVVVIAELAEKEGDDAEELRWHVGPVVKEGLGHDATQIKDHGVELTARRAVRGGRLLCAHRLHCA
jgi:hypothetical protein